MKGVRALGVRVPSPGRALAQDGRLFGRTDGRLDGWKFSPMFYWISSSLGPLPKRRGRRRGKGREGIEKEEKEEQEEKEGTGLGGD